jgi:hypothetical protein
MTERPDPIHIDPEEAYKVWSVTEFAARHNLDDEQQQRLLKLFGPFATACELLYNAERDPKWR